MAKKAEKTRRKIHRTQRYFGAHEVSITVSLSVRNDEDGFVLVLIHKRSLCLRTGLYSQYTEVESPSTKKNTLTS